MPINSLNDDWNDLLKEEFNKPYYRRLSKAVKQTYKTATVFPPETQVFNALNLCSFNLLKVVIIGQDPYHRAGQANGLSFSVNDGVRKPPSLQNIFKELQADVPEFILPESGNLEAWARQGILMLNAVLTVQEGLPGSHKAFGWEQLTDAIIRLISDKKEHVVFLLWGNYAKSKSGLINTGRHLVLTSPHPSPLARRGFFGNHHFSKTNKYLTENGLSAITWNLISR